MPPPHPSGAGRTVRANAQCRTLALDRETYCRVTATICRQRLRARRRLLQSLPYLGPVGDLDALTLAEMGIVQEWHAGAFIARYPKGRKGAMCVTPPPRLALEGGKAPAPLWVTVSPANRFGSPPIALQPIFCTRLSTAFAAAGNRLYNRS